MHNLLINNGVILSNACGVMRSLIIVAGNYACAVLITIVAAMGVARYIARAG